MNRIVFAIKSDEGLLCDIEKYTTDLLEAVVFTDFDVACKRLASVSGLLKNDCWIEVEYMPFPRPKPVSFLSQPY